MQVIQIMIQRCTKRGRYKFYKKRLLFSPATYTSSPREGVNPTAYNHTSTNATCPTKRKHTSRYPIGLHSIGWLNCSYRRCYSPAITYYQLRLPKAWLSRVINTSGVMGTVIQRSSASSRRHTCKKHRPILPAIITSERNTVTGWYKSSVFNYLQFHVYELKRNCTRPTSNPRGISLRILLCEFDNGGTDTVQ